MTSTSGVRTVAQIDIRGNVSRNFIADIHICTYVDCYSKHAIRYSDFSDTVLIIIPYIDDR